MVSKNLRLGVAVLTAAALAGGCGGSEAPPAAATARPDAKRVDAATAGTIGGRVSFEGTVPQFPPIKLDSDPACAAQHPNGLAVETIVVNNGGLENVFVYVKDGLGNYVFDTPTEPVTLDQKGCRYSPHVFGVRTGQPILIVNSDPTMHNVHGAGNVNQQFNFAQVVAGVKNTRTLTAAEVMMPFKCNVHTWMTAYAGVLPHPYFAVTANGGTFELKNLPPGTYTIEAWHEKLGTSSQSVTLAEKESKTLTFTFALK
jgi:hypothetical protein